MTNQRLPTKPDARLAQHRRRALVEAAVEPHALRALVELAHDRATSGEHSVLFVIGDAESLIQQCEELEFTAPPGPTGRSRSVLGEVIPGRIRSTDRSKTAWALTRSGAVVGASDAPVEDPENTAKAITSESLALAIVATPKTGQVKLIHHGVLVDELQARRAC